MCMCTLQDIYTYRGGGAFMSYLRYLCLWCPTHIVLCFCFVFYRLVYPRLPVSLECPFSIAPSVFSNVNIWSKKISFICTNFTEKWHVLASFAASNLHFYQQCTYIVLILQRRKVQNSCQHLLKRAETILSNRILEISRLSRPRLCYSRFVPFALHGSGTSKASSGPGLNNTDD